MNEPRRLGPAPIGVALAAAMIAIPACRAPRFADGPRFWHGPGVVAARADGADARALPMFDGHDGTPIGWTDVMGAADWANVIVIGEQHDDGLGHAVQRAVVEDVTTRWPGTALALEMLERDEQPDVDDYVEGIIDADRFEKRTFSTNWGAKGRWVDWYLPIIDAARERGAPIVAANAPRRYVRLARTDGYLRLAQLPAERRRWLEWPARIDLETTYAKRFRALMGGGVPPEAGGRILTDEQVLSVFRSQLVWDETMGDSTARALRSAPKVILLIGQFHSDFEGGTIDAIRRRRPDARILIVSLRRAWPGALLDEDRGRADVIVYTGERPPPEEPIENAPTDTDDGASVPPAPVDEDAERPPEPDADVDPDADHVTEGKGDIDGR